MTKKALFIVEGEKEREVVKAFGKAMGINLEIFSVHANIHMLYDKLINDDFQVDIAKVLSELKGVSEDDKQMLHREENFAFTYLIFDADPQHKKNIEDSLRIIKEMLQHFSDETDGTVGKMYVNYPMVESFFDCRNLDDDEYKERTVALSDVSRYKQIVGERGMNRHLNSYKLSDLQKLALMNIKKAHYMIKGEWNKPEYSTYINDLGQSGILKAEEKCITKKKFIYVLNSVPFIMSDYWGNKDGFYDLL